MAQTQKENEWPQIRSNMPLTQTHRRKRKKEEKKKRKNGTQVCPLVSPKGTFFSTDAFSSQMILSCVMLTKHQPIHVCVEIMCVIMCDHDNCV